MITTTRNAYRNGNEAAVPVLGGLETLLTFDQAAEALGSFGDLSIPAKSLS